jgi:hypothetical protein
LMRAKRIRPIFTTQSWKAVISQEQRRRIKKRKPRSRNLEHTASDEDPPVFVRSLHFVQDDSAIKPPAVAA